ncbi:MAG TPA: BlaI/MecI/CopY family transcriptional regulator [Gemmatimonadaceae bacterium]|nr:BlaI/MecI/CopY family transcriptional regulator [Gemmatimonadaceae bacterium]
MQISFTDRELDVMAVLWEHGPSTVAEVRQRLADDLAYNTVLTILRTLEEKGHVGHEEEGRAHRYRPLVAREAAGTSALRRIVGKIFGGSPELLLTQLVGDRDLGRDELERLRRLLDERLRDTAGDAPGESAPPGAPARRSAKGGAGRRGGTR